MCQTGIIRHCKIQFSPNRYLLAWISMCHYLTDVNNWTYPLFFSDYNATKAAVISLTKTLADELVKDNVLVNAVCPGPVRTPLWEDLAKLINPQDPEGMIAGFAAANIPMGRFGRPAEVASLVVFLASERASFITGAAYDVDGGMVKYMV